MQQDMSHQMMGYDRTSTMFSPEGRLLQVEYAKKTVKQGTATIGMVCKDGVLLVADKRIIDKLIVHNSVEKIFQIDDHIGAAASGILSDGRILIEKSQIMAQQHRVTYDSPVDTLSIVKEVANIKQQFTQYGGARPFGVSILFAGVENYTPRLFMTDVTGIFFEYKATVIGEYETEIKEMLEKEYNENLTIQDGLKFSIKALKKVLGKEYDVTRIDAAYITLKDKKYTKFKQEELKKI